MTYLPLTIAFCRMINVTDRAVNHLRSLLADQPVSEGKGLRVQVAKGGCSGLQYEMSLDRRQAGDYATQDFDDGLTGSGFRFVNPNAARTCGCCTSFEPVRPA